MSNYEYTQTDREKAFLDQVEDVKYQREIVNGLSPFFNEKAPEDMMSFYTEDDLTKLKVLKGTERDVEKRMPVKVTRHYHDLASRSRSLQKIVKGNPAETNDLAGSEDPGNQMDYSPVEGPASQVRAGAHVRRVDVLRALPLLLPRGVDRPQRSQAARRHGRRKRASPRSPRSSPTSARTTTEVVKANGGVHPETRARETP